MRERLIADYIKNLAQSLGGIRPNVEPAPLRVLYEKKDFTGMVKCIAHSFNLNLRIRVEFANNTEGPVNAPAWVSYSIPMPMYGTKEFKNARITVYIRKSFLKHAPFESVVFAMAHELCHIILDSIGHELKKEEVAVDLTAMMLGFRHFYFVGWQYLELEETRCTGHALGYLKFDEVVFATILMEGMEQKF